MYHFDNGYHAEIEKANAEYAVHVTGNNTDVKIIHLSSAECADVLIRLRDQQPAQ